MIQDNELLYRAVKKTDPNSFINDRPCAALFIDKNGVSVDRDGGRDEKEIIDSFIKRFNRNGRTDNYIATVKILAKECRDVDCYIHGRVCVFLKVAKDRHIGPEKMVHI